MIYILAAFVSFGAVFLKIFQQKNIIGDHIKAAAATSYAIAAFDVSGIMVVVNGGWGMIFPLGTGGALGVVGAWYFHGRIFKGAQI